MTATQIDSSLSMATIKKLKISMISIAEQHNLKKFVCGIYLQSDINL